MSAEYAIGIDLGGTNIKGGVCDAAGRLLTMHAIDTQAEGGFTHVFGRMVALVDTLIAQAGIARSAVAGIGLGTPGPLSHALGIVYSAPNLPGWVNIPIRERFSAATGLPVALENDANAAAYAEFTCGAGRAARSMVLLTLGTGIGGGIVVNGELWRGCDDSAGEIGHLILVPGGRACPCGQRGCFERYASANALVARFQEAAAGERTVLSAGPEGLTARDIEEAARSGDTLAARIWDETCRDLALGCVSLERILAPDMIVFSGGLTNAGAQMLDPVRRHFLNLRWRLTRPTMELRLSALGAEAGTIGAALLARGEAAAPTGRPA